MLSPFSLNGIANIQQKIESAKKIVFFLLSSQRASGNATDAQAAAGGVISS